MFKWNFLCFDLRPLPLVLSLDITEDNTESDSVIFIPSHHIFKHIDKILPSFFRLNSHCSRPLIIFVALCRTSSLMSMYFLYWGTQNWTEHARIGLTNRSVEG